MSSNDEGGASAPITSGDKSRRSVPVGSGIGGIVLVGGVLAVGMVAGALVKMKRRRKGREIRPGCDNDHEVSGQILKNSSEESASGQSPQKLKTKKMEELKNGEQTEAGSAENAEEIQPCMEVEPMHRLIDSISVKDWENKSGSKTVKDQDSPRSHFSLSECPSVDQISMESSDSDDFSEVTLHNNFRSQRNQQTNVEVDCNPQEEEITSGQVGDEVCSDSRMSEEVCSDSQVGEEVLVFEKEYSGGKESLDPKLEYEESVGSVDGPEELSKVVGLVEQTDGKEESVENTSRECNSDFKGIDSSMGGLGFGEKDCQQDGVDVEQPGTENSPSVHVHLSTEICYSVIPAGCPVSQIVKGNAAGLEQEECQQATVDSPLQENVYSSCDVDCIKEQSSQGVIGSDVSQDFGIGMSSYCNQQGQDEGSHSRDSDDSKKIVYLINKQCHQEIDGFEETEFTGKDVCPRQYGTVHCNKLDNSDDLGLVNEPCQHQACKTRKSKISKEDVYSDKGQCQKKNVDLMDDGSLEEEFPVHKEEWQQLKIDSKESEEVVEDKPVVKKHCEDETIDSKEREHVEGNAPICKEKCQEEVIDSKESQNLIEDILVYKNEQCDEETIEPKEFEDAEDMPVLEEKCQEKRVDSKESHDSADNIPVKNEQCQQLISEPEKIQDVEEDSHKEECQEAVDAEDTKISERVHAYIEELCQKEIVDSRHSESLQGDLSPCNEQCQLEIVDSVKLNDLENPCKKQCEKEDATLLNEQCPNNSVGPEACKANSQTHNKPEGVDSEESEYSSGDTLFVSKQHQPETGNPEKSPKDDKETPQIFSEGKGFDANEAEYPDDMETPQIYNEGKGVDANEAEYQSEDTPLINDPKEVKQHVTTTGMPNSTRKRVKNDWHQVGSSIMDFKSEENVDEYPAMHLDRPLPVKIKLSVSLFAGFLLFLLICKVVTISISMPAS